jgi:hypothetical protein
MLLWTGTSSCRHSKYLLWLSSGISVHSLSVLGGGGLPVCMSMLGCAVIFASKRNEAKRKRNFFRFDAKKSDFFACFASMRNVEIWSETKMKQSENETKKKRNCRNFRFEAKWSETEPKFFSLWCEKSVWKWNEAKKTKKKRKLQSKKG